MNLNNQTNNQKYYPVKRRTQASFFYFIVWGISMLIVSISTYMRVSMFLSLILFLIFVVVGIWGVRLILSRVPIGVTISSKGISLRYSQVGKFAVSSPFYVRRSKKEIPIEIKGNDVLIKWCDIGDIKVGNGWTKPRCLIEMVNGDKAYFLNNVDRKIIKYTRKAWEEWKARSEEDLNKKNG